jgi:membrane associated rhomboid family serine protease
MRPYWNQFQAMLTPGVRGVLLLVVTLFVVSKIGQAMGVFCLPALAALVPANFGWHNGWTLVTHAFVSGCPTEFLFAVVSIIFLGPIVERFWSRGELWSFLLVCAAGAGLWRLLVSPLVPGGQLGVGCLTLALAVAVYMLSGRERVNLIGLGEMEMRRAATIMLVFLLVMMLVQVGLRESFGQIGGAVAAWFYLTVRWWWNLRQTGKTATSERIRRLEL